jgi:hypothetical protein
MNIQRPSCALVVALIATQVLGPALLWAADQRGIRVEANRRVLIAAISGEQLRMQNGGDSKAMHFRDAVNPGDQIVTGDRTVAEVLIGNRAVVTLGQSTTAQFTAVSDEQAAVQVKKGIVRVAASAVALGAQGKITIQTPTGQVQTRGGIIRVLVDAPVGSAEHTPVGEARPYRASYSPNTMIAAANTRGDIIQVEEGTAEISGAGPGGRTLTVKSGQAVTMQSGQVGSIPGLANQAGLRVGVLASAGHSKTPKEGLENLVAVQVNQATALGNALTGAAETGQGDSGKKDDSKNVLNGATGGVALASNSLVNSLFGGGSASNPTTSNPVNSTGTGFGGNNNTNFAVSASMGQVAVNDENALLIFTRKDSIEAYVKENILLSIPDIDPIPLRAGTVCDGSCFRLLTSSSNLAKLEYKALRSDTSLISVDKELLLVGGAPNTGHDGIAPKETLIIRGASLNGAATVSNRANPSTVASLFPSDIGPAAIGAFRPVPTEITRENSTFVVESPSVFTDNTFGPNHPGGYTWDRALVGGTLGQYSNLPDLVAIPESSPPAKGGIAITIGGSGSSHVDGAITATESNVVLTGGVMLDQGTKATIGTTEATNNYFPNPNISGGKSFSGSLLALIHGPTADIPTSVTVKDRLLGVYDGSTIDFDTNGPNKALLSVLDAKLKGPDGSIPLIDIANGKHFAIDPAELVTQDKFRTVITTDGAAPNVRVTSALVVRSTISLDGALLEASGPLLALTKATMTTTSHFADLAGNKNQYLVVGKSLPGDAMVALSASTLTINGNLLNLNGATATVNGYLFSLNNGSSLTLNDGGALFSLTNGSSLNLNGNAFGVFGSGSNTLSITNNLCAAACGQLVNSAGQAFSLPVGGPTGPLSPILVAGTTQNVTLPNNFNVFALAPGASASNVNISIGANDALFKVDSTSTLTINGTKVQ